MEKFLAKHSRAIITALGAIAAAVAGGLVTHFLQIGNKPDLRYEEMPYYRMGDVSVASLKLENFGGSDAEHIKLRAQFPKPLAEPPQTSDDSNPFKAAPAFTKDRASITGEIERIVPGQSLYVYFTVQGGQMSSLLANQTFVTEISYKGGMAKTGRPVQWLPLASYLVICLVVIVSFSGFAYKIGEARALDRSNKRLEGLLERAKANDERLKELRDQSDNLRQFVKSTAERAKRLEEKVDEVRRQSVSGAIAASVHAEKSCEPDKA